MSEELCTAVVRKREVQGNGVVVLELADKAGKPLPLFDAGAHIDLHLDNGLIRQYSLCGDPANRECYRLGVLNDPNSRGGSKSIFDSLVEGSELTISSPRNLFPLSDDKAPSLLIGGGIGITPMISMAYSLMGSQRPFSLWYCGRSRQHSAFVEELNDAPFSAAVHTYFTTEHNGQRLDFTTVIPDPATGTHLYVCGPVNFMEGVIQAAQQLGYKDDHIHREFFNVEVETTGSAFEVYAEQSGITIQVQEHETIASALKAAGIKVQVSCEQGTCGTCLCDVLEGTPDHRDVYLTDEEKEDNDQMTLCCSRAKSARLVLDI
ncbi:PDR/VanB family oxidoreductase [Vibrio viridaestus]|uniref:Oxidoreductase n=1 Tax=Vibrio viridaestus TaxID=2487322 RepID=A0A3N9TDU9_9VIBR|nr:PDR/VanB family oxidoreductase [Vibrio viridaestus]RQW62371.1 oxidoreductase [Vibrio viridaestus]